MAARDKYSKSIDAAQRLAEDDHKDENTGNIAAPFGESVFHSGGDVKEDGLITVGTCVDFGDDSPEEVEDAFLNKRINEVVKNGPSKPKRRS